MLTVIQRPDAHLLDVNDVEYFYSRWSAAHLPLVYKIETDKSPINTSDATDAYTGVFSNKGYASFDLSGTYQEYVLGQKVKVTGTVYNGIYEVKAVTAGEYVTLDVLFTATDTGTIVTWYDNYQVLVELYAGIPFGHPFDAEDPMSYIGTFAIAPNSSNIAIIDVADLVRQKINQKNDINASSRPNDLNVWTSFYIKFAETHDIYSSTIPVTYVSDYETDLLDGCTSLSIANGDFDSNLNGWDQNGLTGRESYPWAWDAGTAKVIATAAGIFSHSETLSQSVGFKANIQYELTVIWRCVCSSYDKDWSFNVYASDSLTLVDGSYDQIFYRSSDSSISEQTSIIEFTLNSDREYLIFHVLFPAAYANSYLYIKSVSLLGDQDCKAYIYAHNGTRQFYDLVKNQRTIYGGNMAEYVMNYNTQGVLGKFLTRFETPTIFDGKYFDISCIIPQTTLDIPATEDGLIYRIKQYSNEELASTTDTEILNSGDGVYRLRLDDKITYEYSTVQLIRKQTTVDWDSIYLTNTASFFVGNGNYFSEVALDSGYIAQDSFVYAVKSAVIIAHNGGQTKVYTYIDGVLSLLTTQTFTGDYLFCQDDLNWVVRNAGTSSYTLVSINGVIALEYEAANYYTRGVAGIDIDNVYLCNQSPYGLAAVRKRQSNGEWVLQYPFMSIGEVFTSDIPSRIAVTDENIYVIYNSGGARIRKTNIITTSSVDYYLDASTEKSISVLSETEIVAASSFIVYFFNGSSYVQDNDFIAIKTASVDITVITDCYYDTTGVVTVTTLDRIYQKTNGVWTTGVAGDYTVSSSFSQYASRYAVDNVVLEVSEIKPLRLESSCTKQSVYLSWINSLGNWEYFLFTARKTYEKEVTQVTTTKRNIFANFPNEFTSETENDKINIEAVDRMTVRSQYVTKEQLDILAEIITSIRVQMWYTSNEKITVIVDSKKVSKYSDGDKLYAVEFDILFPQNQTIRQ